MAAMKYKGSVFIILVILLLSSSLLAHSSSTKCKCHVICLIIFSSLFIVWVQNMMNQSSLFFLFLAFFWLGETQDTKAMKKVRKSLPRNTTRLF